MRSIKVTKKRMIGPDEPVFITVDIGKNHNGSMKEAKWLIDKAVEAKVDAVKFQTHIVDDEIRNNEEISSYANKKGVIFYSTPMSTAAGDLLDEIGVPLFKVGSADVSDLFMIESLAKKKKPIILSTGMHHLDDVSLAIKTIKKHSDKIVLMHCVSEYPCPPEHLNLKVIETLRDKFDFPVGLSDHVLEIETACAAVALGAVAIEKHFTRDRTQFGPDHKVSLTPDELKEMVKRIRNVEKAIGSPDKTMLKGESKFTSIFYKSLTSLVDISKGTVITRDMLTAKRPGDGIYTKDVGKVLGKKAKTNIAKDQLIRVKDLE
jgi:N-acetylneuraminate synthase/N,N'-diacetyllegionaminate synthase